MLDSLDIARLFKNVLRNDAVQYNISPEAVKFGIECMAYVYSEREGLKSERSQVADYTDPAHRCAYLHKYAALHTAMVRDMLSEAIHANYQFFRELVFSGEQFKLCCLGGGPGTDVIGVLASLHATFSYFDASAVVVDYMAEWSNSFASILYELGSGMYGAFGNNISHFLNWQYVGANLLKTFQPDVIEVLSTATMVTMVKFASAAACTDTYFMIKNIFTFMKPGAVLLFIDNDGGGFHKLIADAAVELNFISIFGPLRESYMNDFCRNKRFGYNSCFKTTVTVHMLRKPVIFNPYINNYVSTRTSLLGSPLTPFLYLGRSPDVNANRLSYASAYDVKRQHDFSRNENYAAHPGFLSPVAEIPPSPNNAIMPSRIASPFSIYTPDSRHKGKRARMQGCFPTRNFRHHLSRKVNQVKARARSIFKKKIKGEKKSSNS